MSFPLYRLCPPISLLKEDAMFSDPCLIFGFVCFIGYIELNYSLLFAKHIMDFKKCIPPCSCFIVSGDTHSRCVKCLGIAHARVMSQPGSMQCGLFWPRLHSATLDSEEFGTASTDYVLPSGKRCCLFPLTSRLKSQGL